MKVDLVDLEKFIKEIEGLPEVSLDDQYHAGYADGYKDALQYVRDWMEEEL